jgi:zinc transporter ZupT
MTIFASSISVCGGESEAADTIQGVFSSLAAGSLLYVSLCEQVGDLEDQVGTKLLMIIAFCLGFAAMALLAIWE